ncbi:hypothetical protein BJV78DRAFT_1313349 [Lactifluus subvellereus]|nr:hypothetical protein BJV78DRAFT_1313349 [Lactifluus subvellereus]
MAYVQLEEVRVMVCLVKIFSRWTHPRARHLEVKASHGPTSAAYYSTIPHCATCGLTAVVHRMAPAPSLCIRVDDERRAFRVPATMIDTYDVTETTLADHSDGGRGADVVSIASRTTTTTSSNQVAPRKELECEDHRQARVGRRVGRLPTQRRAYGVGECLLIHSPSSLVTDVAKAYTARDISAGHMVVRGSNTGSKVGSSCAWERRPEWTDAVDSGLQPWVVFQLVARRCIPLVNYLWEANSQQQHSPQTATRLAAHVGSGAWNLTTSAGCMIKNALDLTITVPPVDELASNLFPSVGAGATVFGDAYGSYTAFLARSEPNYPAEPRLFVWNPGSHARGYCRRPDAVQNERCRQAVSNGGARV